MPFRVRRRSQRDGSRRASLPRCSGGWLALTAFLPDASLFRGAPSRPSRTGPSCARRGGFSSDLRRATALVSFSACSGPRPPGSVTRCAGASRSPAGARAPDVPGYHPGTSTCPSPSRALARPPGDRDFPRAAGDFCAPSALVARTEPGAPPKRATSRAGRSGFPRAAGWIGTGACAHRCAPTVGETVVVPRTPAGSPPAPLAGCRSAAAEPPPCDRRLVSEADGSFAGCLADLTGARPLPGLPPSAGRCHPTRRVPPSWFDPHLDGLLRAPAPRLLHLVPA